MKIISITTDPNAGGSSKSLLILINGLKKLGHDVLVIIPKSGFLCDNLKMYNIPYLTVPTVKVSIWPRLKNINDIIKFLPRLIYGQCCKYITQRKIKSIAKTYNPDIIHSNVSLFTDGYKVALDLGIKHVWHIREYGDLDFGLNIYPSKKLHNAKLQKGYTIAITQGIKKYFNLSNDRNIVIYNGIKSKYQKLQNKEKDNYWLFVGHVNENKGVSDLIEAYIGYRAHGGDKRLLIVGHYDENYKNKLQKSLKQHNIEQYVEFLGQRNDIDYLMQKAFALIVPSKYEAFGRITAEAMLNNCLVIGRNTAGTKEQIELGNNEIGKEIAFLFNDVKELMDTLLAVDKLNNNEYLDMISLAKEYALNNYTTEKNIELTEKFFYKVLNTK